MRFYPKPSVLALPILATFLPASAGAAIVPFRTHAPSTTFTVIATVPGGPSIGATLGTTLYGTTKYGGNGNGTLFSLSQSGQNYSLLHTFTGTPDGSFPDPEIVTDGKGDVFGASQDGGASGLGSLWEWTTKKQLAVLHSFSSENQDGTYPTAGPLIYDNSILVGSASAGAIDRNGLIYSYDLRTATYTAVYDFLSGPDGHSPLGGVARGKHGYFFGTTAGNGTGGDPNGSIWQLSGSTLTTLYTFQDGNDGEWPNQTPTVDKMDNVYGTTYIQNGNSVGGAIWLLNKKGQFSVLHDLNQSTDGGLPDGQLLLNTDGNLYGSATVGGQFGFGTIFKITPGGTFTVLHAFSGGNDGSYPTGPLVHDAAGNVYGGVSSGQVFEITP